MYVLYIGMAGRPVFIVVEDRAVDSHSHSHSLPPTLTPLRPECYLRASAAVTVVGVISSSSRVGTVHARRFATIGRRRGEAFFFWEWCFLRACSGTWAVIYSYLLSPCCLRAVSYMRTSLPSIPIYRPYHIALSSPISIPSHHILPSSLQSRRVCLAFRSNGSPTSPTIGRAPDTSSFPVLVLALTVLTVLNSGKQDIIPRQLLSPRLGSLHFLPSRAFPIGG